MENRKDDIYRLRCPENRIRDFFDSFKKSVEKSFDGRPHERYVNLNGTIVRLMIYGEEFLQAVRFCLDCTLVGPGPYEFTIVVWETSLEKMAGQGTVQYITETSGRTLLLMTLSDNGMARGFDRETNTFYCGYPHASVRSLAAIGQLFVLEFHKILKNKPGALVHGACVGIDGKGVLLCGRGGMGKSTLAVSALLRGFEYVSDDYLIVEKEDGRLLASPIYSVIKLTKEMYAAMQDELQGCVHIGDAHNGEKLVLNISSFNGSFRTRYPISLCLMPEIVPGLEKPSIISCTEEEKGKATIRMVHSTILQLSNGKDNDYNLKLMQILKDQKFYRIRLSRDIYENVECLRAFMKNYDALQ